MHFISKNKFSRRGLTRIFFALISSVLTYVTQVHAAELNVRVLGGKVIDSSIEGEIQPGDYDRFVNKIKNGGIGTTLWLNSSGGDVLEAIKIGSLIRTLRMETKAPDRTGNKTFCQSHPKGTSLDKCNCASACFLIFVAGINRSGNHLGIHRIFLNHDQLRLMSPDEASEATGKATNVISAYLSDMGVPIHFIQRLMAIPSNKIEWVSQQDISLYFSGYIPQYSEWVAAKCKSSLPLIDEATSLIMKKKQQGLTVAEEQLLSKTYAEIEVNTNCEATASKEIRSDAQTKVIKTLQLQR